MPFQNLKAQISLCLAICSWDNEEKQRKNLISEPGKADEKKVEHEGWQSDVFLGGISDEMGCDQMIWMKP